MGVIEGGQPPGAHSMKRITATKLDGRIITRFAINLNTGNTYSYAVLLFRMGEEYTHRIRHRCQI